jgi:Trypsin-like peptidase domain
LQQLSDDLANAITAVMQYLYSDPRRIGQREELLRLNQHIDPRVFDHAIEKAKRSDLLLSFPDDKLGQTGPGLEAFFSETFLPTSLGRDHIVRYASPAVVHVIVSGKKKSETGAVGFYCSDASNRIVTAAHNIIGRNILRIEDAAGNVLHSSPIVSEPIKEGLDLAILNVTAPTAATKLRIEWDQNKITHLSPVYVFGFPQIPQHTIALVTRSGELCSIIGDYSRRTSYLIPRITVEGFSGGPAVNDRGRVIGVIQGRPYDPISTNNEDAAKPMGLLAQAWRAVVNKIGAATARATSTESVIQKYDSEYSALTPAWYLAELPGISGPRESPILGGFLSE